MVEQLTPRTPRPAASKPGKQCFIQAGIGTHKSKKTPFENLERC
jgi:hypothetical protein